MNLTKQDADLYFDLMWKLQWYVNNVCKIISPIKSPQAYAKISTEDKLKVRTYLFDNYDGLLLSIYNISFGRGI